MKSEHILYGFIGAVIVIVIFVTAVILIPQPVTATSKQVANDFATQSSGSTDEGDVLLELQPKQVVTGEMIVEFTVNTHSVALKEYDLAQMSTLIVDGTKIKATRANSMSGHHNNGEIVFAIDTEPKQFSIIIKGLPAQDIRTHEWG
jgi:hypothetical protein